MKYLEKDILPRFGHDLVGVIPWGTHLCQFYETKQDLIDILVPYFAEGLHSNEFCMWITSVPLEVDEATKALKETVPDLEEYIRNGQIEIISYKDWYLLEGKFDSGRVLQGWLKKENTALKRGFEGLRLTGNTFWLERDLWNTFVDYEESINSVIAEHRIIAVCTYCLTSCSGTDVVDVVRNHVGTLIKQVDKWYLMEDAARRKAVNVALTLSEQKYTTLFENMQDGFAYHKVLFDEAGRPVDYVFLEINDTFERLTGLKRENIVGKRVTQVLQGIEKDPANWINVYGRVALTGEPVRFENYSADLHRWYLVSAYSPQNGYFVATLEDVTERKKTETSLNRQSMIQKGINRILGKAISARTQGALGEACLAVAEEITESKFGFIGEINAGGLEDVSISNPGWDACIMHDLGGHRRLPSNFKIHGIYGRVLLDGEGLFTNDPANHPDSIGLPLGHPPLKSFLGVPLKNEGKTIGIIAVANREGGYSEAELETLEALTPAAVEAFMRKRAEQKIINLSKFPSENPNIIFRVGSDGTLLYLNPAGNFLLDEWKTNIGETVPERINLLVAEALESQRKIQFEHRYGGRVFIFTLSAIIKEGYVNFYGIDITELKEIEDAIRRLNERFEMAQQAAGVGVWDWDLKTNHIEWTPEMFLLFGLDPKKDTASLENWNSILHSEDREKVAAKIDEALKTHSFLSNEYRIIRPNGRIVWINALGKGIYDDQNKPTRMIGICLDITERKKAEETLREQNFVINSASDAIYSTDNSFTFKTWNRAAEHIFGWKAEEVIGKSTISIFNPIYPTLNGMKREPIIEVLLKNGFWRGEIIYHKKDGSPIPVSVSASLSKDDNKNVTGVVVVAHDISTRIKREKVLKEIQQDLNRAQAVAKTGSWRLDTQHNVLLWSDENYRIFGVSKGTSLTYETFLDFVHPDDREYVDKKWKLGLIGKPYDIEHRIIIDGRVKWVREKAELEFAEDGTLLGGFGTTQEITDMVEMREKLSFYSKHLEALVEEKTKELKNVERLATIGQTAGMIGHDIRNPLQSIDGAIYLAKEAIESLPDKSEEKNELKEILSLIKEQVSYIDHMVADLQDFARTATPQLEETNTQKLIRESLSMIRIPENIQTNVILPDDSLRLIVDRIDMKRILVNLIKNAVQAMPDGGVLTVRVLRKEKEAWICIEDTGVGIAERIKPKLFTPLFTTKSKGQGFGLAVCKKLIDAQSGEITFDSEEGKGSTFIIKLPLKREV